MDTDAKPDMRTELVAGVTTFFTMAYIVFVNPLILSGRASEPPVETGMPFSGVLTATVVVCFTMTLLMGIYARLPFAVAPGMGINAFFVYAIILGRGVPWQVALGAVFWAGVLFLLVSLTPLREMVARAIPRHLRLATAAGIGVFLTFIGLKNAGFIAADPATLVRLGRLDYPALLMLLGLAVTVLLLKLKSPFAFLAGIFVVTLVGWLAGKVTTPPSLLSAPDFRSVFFKLDILGALKLSLLPAVVTILFTDLFDSVSTFIGVSQAAGMLDEEGHPRRLREGLIVDAWATLGAGLAGTSSGTAYIESVAGINTGGRTGWTSVFTAACFLPCLFVAPLAGMVPPYATAAVLVVVGVFMFSGVSGLDFKQLEDALPAFLTIILIPLTFSITQGILWGFITHAGLYTLAGRAREVGAVMYALAVVSVGLLLLERFA